MLRIVLPAFAASLLLFAACASEMREVAPRPPGAADDDARPGVSAEGWVDVEVTAGAGASTRIECDQDLLPRVHVEERNGTVHVWNDGDLTGFGHDPCTVFLRREKLERIAATGSGDVRVRGPAPDLGAVVASGSGDVTIEDAGAQELQIAVSGSGSVVVGHAASSTAAIDLSGSGNVRVSGTSRSATLTLSGSGDLDARAFQVEDATVAASGSGDVSIGVSKRITASASGSGDVKVLGQPPERMVSKDGSGDVLFD